MREHRLIFDTAPVERLPDGLREGILKMGTSEWKDEVKKKVHDDLNALKEKVELEEARKLIESRESGNEEEKEALAVEKKIFLALIDTRLKVMDVLSPSAPGMPSGVPEPIRTELKTGLAKMMAGVGGVEAAGKLLKITPDDGAREILRMVDLAWNKFAASIFGQLAKIPFIGDSFRAQAEKAQESILMLEMQGGFASLVREMRAEGREVSIAWKAEAWSKWKEAHQKSGISAKEFAKDTAKKYVEGNPALAGEIAMNDIPLPGVAPALAPPEAPKPGAADVATAASAPNGTPPPASPAASP